MDEDRRFGPLPRVLCDDVFFLGFDRLLVVLAITLDLFADLCEGAPNSRPVVFPPLQRKPSPLRRANGATSRFTTPQTEGVKHRFILKIALFPESMLDLRGRQTLCLAHSPNPTPRVWLSWPSQDPFLLHGPRMVMTWMVTALGEGGITRGWMHEGGEGMGAWKGGK